MIVSTDSMTHSMEHKSQFALLPTKEFSDFTGPPATPPRSGSHERAWIAAYKGGPTAMSNFDYAGPLAEFVLLSNVATQLKQAIEYDPIAGMITNTAAGNAALSRAYREGWSLQSVSDSTVTDPIPLLLGSGDATHALGRPNAT